MAGGTITTLVSAGIDAFSHLFDVRFVLPTAITSLVPVEVNSSILSVRINDFTPPELALQTYSTDYKGISLTRPAPKITGERKLSFSFRMDTNQYLYRALSAWKHIWFDATGEGDIRLGALSETNSLTNKANYGQIVVVAYDAQGALSEVDMGSTAVDPGSAVAGATAQTPLFWVFNNVICTECGKPAFKRSGAEPLTSTASFMFGTMVEPWGNGGLGTYPTSGVPTLNHD